MNAIIWNNIRLFLAKSISFPFSFFDGLFSHSTIGNSNEPLEIAFCTGFLLLLLLFFDVGLFCCSFELMMNRNKSWSHFITDNRNIFRKKKLCHAITKRKWQFFFTFSLKYLCLMHISFQISDFLFFFASFAETKPLLKSRWSCDNLDSYIPNHILSFCPFSSSPSHQLFNAQYSREKIFTTPAYFK